MPVARRELGDLHIAIRVASLLATLIGGVPTTWTIPVVVLSFLTALFIGNAHDVMAAGEDRYA